MMMPRSEGLCGAVAAARHAVSLLCCCCLARLAACWHVLFVVSLLYAFPRPMRPLDLVAIALVADALLLSFDPDSLC